MKQQLKEYFNFSKLERSGVIVLVCLIVLLLVIRYLLVEFYPQVNVEQKDIAKIEAVIDSLEEAQSKRKREDAFKPFKSEVKEVEDFNPNALKLEDWKAFGLSEKQAITLVNYRNKIGGFKSKAQFRKVFVIHEELHEQLSSHILLPDTIQRSSREFPTWKKRQYEKRVRIYPKVDINSADTASFKKLYGIGKVLAERIVKRREELGGFVSKDQLKEVYGLKEETLIQLDTQLVFTLTKIRKISINTATKEELKAHPYLFWKHANAIVNYRKQHGAYQSVEDIKKSVLINDSIFQKVKPYLAL